MINIWKSFALLMAGALASIIGGMLLQSPLPITVTLIFIGVFLILFLVGSGAVSVIWHNFNLWRRKGNKLFTAKVGILNDIKWDKEYTQISSWTDISPEEWKKEIEKCAKESEVEIKVKLINTRRNFDPYLAILNPYGGVYPEMDLKNFETLNKIFNYVNESGLFINVADVPGYWAYNPFLKRRLNATPAIYGISKILGGIFPTKEMPFELTPFMEKLGLRILNLQYGELCKWDVEIENIFGSLKENIDHITAYRAAIVERNIQPIIRPKKFSQNEEMTPFFTVSYGEGKFLMLLLDMEKGIPENMKMKKFLVKILIELVSKKEKII